MRVGMGVCACESGYGSVCVFAYVVPCVYLSICVAVYCSGETVISSYEEPSRIVGFVTPECSGSLCVNGNSDAHTFCLLCTIVHCSFLFCGSEGGVCEGPVHGGGNRHQKCHCLFDKDRDS